MSESTDDSRHVKLAVEQAGPFLVDLIASLAMISRLLPPDDERDINAFRRNVAAASLESVSVFFERSGLAPSYIPGSLMSLAIALLDLNRGIENKVFKKPSNTRKAPDPTQFWLLRAEAAALLKVLIEQGHEPQEQAAEHIYRSLETYLNKITARARDSRQRKDKVAKKARPGALIIGWLAKFEPAVNPESAKESKKDDAKEFADLNFMSVNRFQSHYRGLTAEWQQLPERERGAWVKTRLDKLKMKLKTFSV